MTPFHGAFESPMLVSEIPGHRERILSAPYVFVQPKLDGWCCMANTRTRRIYTRSGREITNLPHIQAALSETGPEWLHGELWRPGADCDVMQSLIKRGDNSVEFHVFDCVSDEYYEKRWYAVDGCCSLRRFSGIHTVSLYKVKPCEIYDIYEEVLSYGYEGIIIRLDSHGYYHGRSYNVFKMKPGTEGV